MANRTGLPSTVERESSSSDGRSFPDAFERTATRANGLRASLGAGSSADDVDRFLDALAVLIADGPAHASDRSPAGWCPRVDDRPRPDFDFALG